jgi:hypothetical protein
MTHHREDVTWLTRSVTASNHRAAIKIETASDSGTASRAAAI